MHLGINLRKAFFSDSGAMDNVLLSKNGGKHGVYECGHGAVKNIMHDILDEGTTANIKIL